MKQVPRNATKTVWSIQGFERFYGQERIYGMALYEEDPSCLRNLSEGRRRLSKGVDMRIHFFRRQVSQLEARTIAGACTLVRR